MEKKPLELKPRPVVAASEVRATPALRIHLGQIEVIAASEARATLSLRVHTSPPAR